MQNFTRFIKPSTIAIVSAVLFSLLYVPKSKAIESKLIKSYNYTDTQELAKPDSSITFSNSSEAIFKSIFTYNADNRLTQKSDYLKDTQTLKWVSSFIREYTYDSIGNLLEEKGKTYNQVNSNYLEKYKNVFSFAPTGRLITQEFYTNSDDSLQLIGNSRYEYIYDNNGSPVSVIEYSRMTNNSWIPNTKYIYGYSNDSIQNLIEIYKYDSTSTSWIKYIKTIQTYDSSSQLELEENYTATDNEWQEYSKIQNSFTNGLLSQSTTYTFSNTQWIPSVLTSFQYRDTLLVSKTSSLYSSHLSAWTKANKDSMEYSSDNKISQKRSYRWNPQEDNWLAVSKAIYNYNNGDDIENYFLSAKNKWVGTNKNTTQYDSSGNMIVDEKEIWEEKDSSWHKVSKVEQTFDNNLEQQTSLTKYQADKNNSWIGYFKQGLDYDILMNGSIALKHIYNYDFVSSIWKLATNTTYYYNDTEVNSINTTTGSHISVTWAPEHVTINAETGLRKVSIFYINGRQYYSGKAQTISTIGWERGVYIVNTEDSEGNYKFQKIQVR